MHPKNPILCAPKTSLASLFLGLLFNNEKWYNFNIPMGNIPSVEQILDLDAIIITGSSLSVLQQSK